MPTPGVRQNTCVTAPVIQPVLAAVMNAGPTTIKQLTGRRVCQFKFASVSLHPAGLDGNRDNVRA